jgi:hypothetical protein
MPIKELGFKDLGYEEKNNKCTQNQSPSYYNKIWVPLPKKKKKKK